jgi:hypothetical protein
MADTDPAIHFYLVPSDPTPTGTRDTECDHDTKWTTEPKAQVSFVPGLAKSVTIAGIKYS